MGSSAALVTSGTEALCGSDPIETVTVVELCIYAAIQKNHLCYNFGNKTVALNLMNKQ
jgi:hypothetical protein